jgi:hypothetical protein
METETRQTLIGVTGLTIVFSVALHEGFNGSVAIAYSIAILALIAPDTLEAIPRP